MSETKSAGPAETLRARLVELEGSWEGVCRTWFDPDAPAQEAPAAWRIRPAGDGAGLLIETESSLDGEAFTGTLLIGMQEDQGKVVTAWVDGFHSESLMISEGKIAGDALIDVLGSYAAGDQRWGWRTVFSVDADGSLTIRAYNVEPSGAEYLGVETVLRRKD